MLTCPRDSVTSIPNIKREKMPTEKHYGIVLKNYFPQKYSLDLLDNKSGRIIGISRAIEHISIGSLVMYTIDKKKQNPLFLYQIELQEAPFALAREDILFLHHILEICYYFIPIGSDATVIYNQLQLLYAPAHWMKSILLKKVFLVKLFAFLGIYPEEKKIRKPFFHAIIINSFLNLLEQDFSENEEEINVWLHRCIVSHPQIDKFKTNYLFESN